MTAPLHAAFPATTTDELAAGLTDPALLIVDARPLAAYNGWRLGEETRGGHIPGAVAFPVSWLRTIDDEEVTSLLTEKGILSAPQVVVYGDGPADAGALAWRLAELGQQQVRLLEGGFPAWAADERLAVERLPLHEKLVHVGWLRTLIDGGSVEAAPSDDWLLFHVNFGVPEEYAEAHLPGALYLDTNTLEDSADWNRRDPDELETAIAGLGITKARTLILYGRDTEGDANEKWPGRRAGQIAATRAALILRYAGVDDVRVLDGGYDAWVRAGHEVEAIPREPAPVASTGLSIPERPELIIDLPEAKAILADPAGGALVSVRTWREHIGAVSGYNYIGPAGRIKGDVWGNCGTDAYHMQHYRTVDNTMRSYVEIASNWKAAGITPDKDVSYYCGTGWRAAETWFYAYIMGWPSVSVYDGGWFEWSQDPEANPIEIGTPLDAGVTTGDRPAA
jgi:thiosulfate/3-mercaptopyruvate sulfurtransferase